MSAGFTFKRCTCAPALGADGKPVACRKRHGSWYFAAEVRTPDGRRRQERRGGFATQALAQEALTEFVAARNAGVLADDRNLSVSGFLDVWLARKVANGLRATTARSYQQHIDHYIVPVIGRMRLRDVHPAHIDEVLAAAARPKEKGKTPGPATIRRIHAEDRFVESDSDGGQ